MSRKPNSGWLYGAETRTVTLDIEGDLNDVFPIIRGADLRESELEAFAGERADYFIERLLVWGVGFYNSATPTSRANSRMIFRAGTIDEANQADARLNFLWSTTNHELWARILKDEFVGVYENPVFAFDGASLVADASLTADAVRSIHQQVGPSHFHLDIQTRFSLQREEDDLCLAFGADNEWAADQDAYTVSYSWKALVKEYRK